MRALVLISILLAVVIGGGVAVFFAVRPQTTICHEQSDILPADRSAIETAALSFVGHLRRGETNDALQSMTTQGRENSRPEQWQQLRETLAVVPQETPFAVEHTYYVSTWGLPSDGITTPCNTAAVSVARAGKTAHVVLTAAIGGGEQSVIVWLERERGAWRVRGLVTGISAIGSHDGQALWDMARDQRSRGHLFNARILYAAAHDTLMRGTFLQTRRFQEFNADYATLPLPPEFVGASPFTWTLGQETFVVTFVTYSGYDDGVMIDVQQRQPSWEGPDAAEEHNRRLIAALNAAHPEWTEIADYIGVGTETPTQGQVFRTVYHKVDGYVARTDTVAPNQ